MKKIIVTVGMSNSGKSTWANQLVQENLDSFIIVNRDKIRELLFGYTESTIADYYNRKDLSAREKQVTRYEDTLINEALETGRTPIVDATHLRREYLERFKYWNAKVELQWFDITLKEAQIRNESRLRKVDDKILIKQYNQYVTISKSISDDPIDFTPVELIQEEFNEPCFIFDIDGTLAHMDREKRSPYDWHKVGLDTADVATCAIARFLSTSVNLSAKVIICTGRDGICLDETEKWLDDNHIKYDEIYIRPRGDQRADWIVKEEMWREISKTHYIVGMFDDRLQVVRRARALGLKVFNVEYNNF